MKKIYNILIFTFICNSFLFAQTEIKNPIDIQCEACLDSVENQSTQGMYGCEWRAPAAWDIELNKYYKLLLGSLDKDEQGKLKSAQKSWLSYKKSETDFYQTSYTNKGGTTWQIFAASRATEIIKARVLELESYYNILTYKE